MEEMQKWLDKKKKKIDIISNAAKGTKIPLEFVEADLLKADTWDNALKSVE